MATELFSSSTRKARSVALQTKKTLHLTRGKKKKYPSIHTLILWWRGYSINYSSMKGQQAEGRKNKVIFRGCEQSAGNCSSPLSNLFSSEERVSSLGSPGTESGLGAGRSRPCVCVCVFGVWGIGSRGQSRALKMIFSLLQGFSVEGFGWVTVVLGDTS